MQTNFFMVDSFVGQPGTATFSGNQQAVNYLPQELPTNGVHSSGVFPSRVLPNGVFPSGVLPNGILPNGVLLNGVLSNGVPLNGVSSNGASSNGAYSNGVPSSGVSSNEVSSNGVPSTRVSPNGVSSNGAPAQSAPMIPPYATQRMPISCIQEEPAQLRKLFIGGLNHETTDEQLRDYYSQWGTVVDCIVIREPQTKQSRGFGFVTYATIKMAEIAMADNSKNAHSINGKVVDPKRAIPREHMLPLMPNNPPHFLESEPAPGCKLILSGIHWDFHTVDGFRQYFEKFGEVEQVEIVGHPRGYGFVVFEERSGAERCLKAGKQHAVNGKRVEVKESTSDSTQSAASASTSSASRRPFNERSHGDASPGNHHPNRPNRNAQPAQRQDSNRRNEPNERPIASRNNNEPPSIIDFPHLNTSSSN